MGTNKALLKIGHQTIIERIIDQTTSINWYEKIIIANTSDEYQCLDLSIFPDVITDSGALGGIYTALYHSKTPYTFVVACDMPFISAKMMQMMMSHTKNCDAVVPVVNERTHSLHAIYSKKCLSIIQTQIRTGQLRIRNLHQQITVNYLTENDFVPINSGIALMNINTLEDLARARHINQQEE